MWKRNSALSSIPVLGIHLAIPRQICKDTNSKSEVIWHYSVRNAVSKISKIISPAGGWGSEVEGKLWNIFGRRLEERFK